MHYADIIANLVKAGHPPSRVARDLGKAPGTVSQIIHGTSKSYDIASHISAVTSIPLKKLWPDGRYATPPKRHRNAA